ncbi:hypothetical protein [Aliiroseovarius sp.]|uniref:hypothetical protein n=1 Tax=Aliiroseovarius sp. TaxID=1872442 RepID=UPI003BAC67CA
MFRFLVFLFLSMFPAAVFAQPLDIKWEITNRFAPFEAHEAPATLFATWKLHNAHESWEGWHARRWVESGHQLTSPYGAALMAGQPTHWDPETRQHRDSVLRFIRHETAPETTVRVRLWAGHTGPCQWHLGGATLQASDCGDAVSARLPLSGAVVTLRLPDGRGASRFLAPDHRIIVAIGDSYGSGQGNPDLPARWRGGLTLRDGAVGWMTRRGNLTRGGVARWLDEPCARSFFSFQSLTALGIASRDPHVFVSFLHHACSGAEIFDGLLSPQKNPGDSKGYNRLSQLNAVIRELCLAPTTDYAPIAEAARGGEEPLSFRRRNGSWLSPGDRLDRGELRRQRTETRLREPRSGILTCPGGRLRAPDMVLLSIGGNDVGFAQLVQYFVAPVIHSSLLVTDIALPDLCPAPAYRVDAAAAPLADRSCRKLDDDIGHNVGDLIGTGAQVGGIAAKYRLLFASLEHYLRIPRTRIVMAQYPDPLRRSEASTDPCGPVSPIVNVFGQKAGLDRAGPWNGLKTSVPTELLRSWQFNLLPGEAAKLLGQFDALRIEITRAAKAEGITFACETRDAFLGHGWWQGRQLTLPNTLAAPWSPHHWRPYVWERNGRAIRTGNDSALTQANGSVAISGAVHPNLTGHSLLADVLMRRLGLGALPQPPRITPVSGPR